MVGTFEKYPSICPVKYPAGKSWSFQKVPINSPGSYPAGKWWALLQSTQHKTQWVLFEQTHFVLSQSVQNVPRGYFVKEPFEFFHNVPINLITICPTGTLRVLEEFVGKLSHIESLLWVLYKEPSGHILIKLMGTL